MSTLEIDRWHLGGAKVIRRKKRKKAAADKGARCRAVPNTLEEEPPMTEEMLRDPAEQFMKSDMGLLMNIVRGAKVVAIRVIELWRG
jgi:hypothetical protein